MSSHFSSFLLYSPVFVRLEGLAQFLKLNLVADRDKRTIQLWG